MKVKHLYLHTVVFKAAGKLLRPYVKITVEITTTTVCTEPNRQETGRWRFTKIGGAENNRFLVKHIVFWI